MLRRWLSIAWLALGLLAAAGNTTHAGTGWKTHSTKGLIVSLPTDWYLVPQRRGDVPDLATRLRHAGNRDLANQYMEIYKDPYQWSDPSMLAAFAWPSHLALTTDITIKRTEIPAPSGRDALRALAASLAAGIRGRLNKGDKVSPPQYASLPAGDSYKFSATIKLDPSYGTAKSYSISYYLRHGAHIYTIVFRGQAGFGGLSAVTASWIARTVRFR